MWIAIGLLMLNAIINSGPKDTVLPGGHPSQADAIINDFYHHPERILISAHRSSHCRFPENSLSAMQEAVRAGIDILELDIRETKDSVLVIMHDKTIDRTSTGKGAVSDLTWAELQKCKLLQEGKPTQDGIPRFEDVLKALKGKIMIDIDFKEDSMRPARETYALIKQYQMEKQVLFFIYDKEDAHRYRPLNPEVPIMPRAYNPADIKALLQIGGFPVVHVDDSYYSDSLMSTVRQAGARVWINALGKYDEAEMVSAGSGFDQLLKMHMVNVIQTDLPQRLLVYLREKGLHR